MGAKRASSGPGARRGARPAAPAWLAAAAAMLVAHGTGGCNLSSTARLDAGGADAVTEAWLGGDGRDEDASGEAADGTVEAGGPGSFTLIVRRAGVTTERLCDMDADGTLDNAIAELGTPDGPLLAGAITTVLQRTLEPDAATRLLMYAAGIDDVAIPAAEAATVVFFGGNDDDDDMEPDHGLDDYLGEEAFYVSGGSLDACGAPRGCFAGTTIDDGELRGDGGTVPLPYELDLARTRAFGRIEPHGVAASLSVCGMVSAGLIGGSEGPTGLEGPTILEVFVAGGAAIGAPGISGLAVDVDVDGDGLERFLLDDSLRLEACVDGDGTVIAGADCWRDARIADGFAVTADLDLLPAVFAGREPYWEAEASEVPCGAPDACPVDWDDE